MSTETPAPQLTTKAITVHKINDLRVETRPVDAVSDSDAVVRVEFGGICGSDLHYWRHGAVGESILKHPMVLGHEVVGTVIRAAADGSGPTIGTRVAVHPARTDSTDHRFPTDRPNLSPGVRYLGSAARDPHTQGAFTELAVLPASMLRVVPDEVDERSAALIEPASVAWHAVARAGDVRGKRVLVIGSGPIGSLVCAVLAHHGAAEIVAVDIVDAPLAVAGEVGATRLLRSPEAGTVAAIDADIAIESSGSHHGLASAIAGTTRGGRVVMVGLLPPGPQPVPISAAIAKELDLVGAFRFHDEIDAVIAALADGSLSIAPVVTHVFAVDEAQTAFELAGDSARSVKVLIRF